VAHHEEPRLMPTSDYHSIPAVLDHICEMNPMPQAVLEIGVGFGKWGVLLREVLDARYGRVASYKWEAKIHGVEVFHLYENPCWRAYTHVQLVNVLDHKAVPYGWPSGFDLILMMDVLEHFEAVAGSKFLDDLVATNKQVIVSVPNGPMPQGEVFGNPHEAHLTTFHGPEFDKYNHKVLHLGLCRVVSIKGGKV
jgi:hypothetical protein